MRFRINFWSIIGGIMLLGGLLLAGKVARSATIPMAVPSQPQEIVPACGTITTDTTWTTGNVYVVQNCALIVQAGATLTIRPGVVVKFLNGSDVVAAGLRVDGRLIAKGTAEQPVVFTSLADDSAGGDTNGDGNSNGTKGNWYGMVLTNGSETILDHVSVRYASMSGLHNFALGWNQAQIEVRQGARFTLTNSEVRDGGLLAVYLNGRGLTPTIRNVHFSGHNYDYTVHQSTPDMQPTYADLTFSNNTRNIVSIGGTYTTLTQDVTLGGTNFEIAPCGYTACPLTIPSGRTLTIMPGTTLTFNGAPARIIVAEGGWLIAEGTATQPITITSATETSFEGIKAEGGSTLRLRHCDISKAREYATALTIATDDAQVANCNIHHNLDKGIDIRACNGSSSCAGRTITFTDVNVYSNGGETTQHSQDGIGVYLFGLPNGTLRLTWEGGSVNDNNAGGIYTQEGGYIEMRLRNVTIEGNGSRNISYQAGISAGRYDNSTSSNLTLENITLRNNAGPAIDWICDSSITARGLTASGNGIDALVMMDCGITSGRQWDLGDIGIPVQVRGVTIQPNGLLTIRPGTVLRFDASRSLFVDRDASLIAVGTPERPIVFTATDPTAYWGGIRAILSATVTLNHCEIGYAGRVYSSVSLLGGWEGGDELPTVNIQNCEIHHSLGSGVEFSFNNYPVTTPPVLRYNRFHDNAQEAVKAIGTPPIDARYNYWGHASGPLHQRQNPSGQGDRVGDNVLFYPWLREPATGEVAGEMLVRTGGPTLISPGETVDYAVQYLNMMDQTISGSILVLQLPHAATFLEGTGGAIYWPERHQVFWKLGDLAQNAEGFLTARVRFDWGLPADYTDGTYTIFAAHNYRSDLLNLSEYESYQPTRTQPPQITRISETELATLRTGNTTLNQMYQQALADGFQYVDASRFTEQDGRVMTHVVLRLPNRRFARVLSVSQDGQVTEMTIGSGQFIVHDSSGGMQVNLTAGEYTFSGGWLAGLTQAAPQAGDCSAARCFANCMFNKHPLLEVVRKAGSVVTTWWIPGVGWVWTAYEVYDTASDWRRCRTECATPEGRANHCCTPGQVLWRQGALPGQCNQYSCDAAGNAWKAAPDLIEKCPFGQRCIPGLGAQGGCKDCRDLSSSIQVLTVARRPEAGVCTAADDRCTGLRVRQAKDPNDITGPTGDLLPGQVVTYTIRYENEGEGRAYGVYVVNRLPDVFDESTLTFVHGTGQYNAASREMIWYVGELGPKGASDSQGVITYTVALRSGLASGTVVSNQAVVYFPSVPEETPTNTWVNLVTPLVAEPQTLTTAYQTPLTITLHGRDVSNLPLTYEIIEQPHGGTLSGTSPNLTYHPFANFSGADGFTFRVSNGTSTSRSATIAITVSPQGDTTPPEVLWSDPEHGTQGIQVSTTAIFSDTESALYAPVIRFGVSEALDDTTVTSTTVMLRRSGGTTIPARVAFDPALQQIVLMPRTVLTTGAYSVTVTTGVKDRAGNALTAPYTIQFMVGTERRIYLPVIQR